MKPLKLTRSQKFWIGALGVGLVALAIDQCVSTSAAGPDAAAASTGPVAEASVATPESPAAKAAAPGDAATIAFDHHLAQSVNELGEAALRDGFAPPPDWAAGNDPAAKPAEKAAVFERSHLLKAVLTGPRPAVLVDGSLIAVGQAFDGFVLVEALPAQATFRCGALTAKLKLGGSDNTNKPENR